MVNIKENKTIVRIAIISTIALVIILVSMLFPGIPFTAYIQSFIGIALLSWLAIAAYLIITGKQESNGNNPERKAGLVLLLLPISLTILIALSLHISELLSPSGPPIVLSLISIIIPILSIVGIAYFNRMNIQLAVISVILILLAILGLLLLAFNSPIQTF